MPYSLQSLSESSNQLKAVQDAFIAEACSAPKLFSDLARMEQYIAESYKKRSFIELIQNADDARAKSFGIHRIGPDILVGNDGQDFTSKDLESLCRSGASQKLRGHATIGYRGVGFKSVVNISQRILVISGDYTFGFDRAETKRHLPELKEVPLIRIPFIPSSDEIFAIRQRASAIQKAFAYTTVFIFESGNDRLIEDELEAIDRHAFLFLRSIEKIEVAVADQHRTISISRSRKLEQDIATVKEGLDVDAWLLLRHPEEQSDIVAFRMKNQEIVSADPLASVIHSFLPTSEASGALLKINGDYSTDPSRKAVDLDELSMASFANAANLIAETLKLSIEGQGILGIFRPFTEDCPPSRFKRLLYGMLEKYFQHAELRINGREQLLGRIRLRPEWLNYEDYEALCIQQGIHLQKELVSRIPELPAFLERFNVPRLSISEALELLKGAKLSVFGSAQLTAKIVNQYRYDLTAERMAFFSELALFPIDGRLMRSGVLKSFEEIDLNFRNQLLEAVSVEDLSPFLQKLGVPLSFSVPAAQAAQHEVAGNTDDLPSLETALPPAIVSSLTRWRSAEKNAEEYFRSLPGVLSVSDVSVANMGYDLEVVYLNGARLFVEVKSVKTFAEPIKITNNEYASAHKYGKSYCLAIVINNDHFELRVVRDPVQNLVFQKQIERWSWICESYAPKLELPADVNFKETT